MSDFRITPGRPSSVDVARAAEPSKPVREQGEPLDEATFQPPQLPSAPQQLEQLNGARKQLLADYAAKPLLSRAWIRLSDLWNGNWSAAQKNYNDQIEALFQNNPGLAFAELTSPADLKGALHFRNGQLQIRAEAPEASNTNTLDQLATWVGRSASRLTREQRQHIQDKARSLYKTRPDSDSESAYRRVIRNSFAANPHLGEEELLRPELGFGRDSQRYLNFDANGGPAVYDVEPFGYSRMKMLDDMRGWLQRSYSQLHPDDAHKLQATIHRLHDDAARYHERDFVEASRALMLRDLKQRTYTPPPPEADTPLRLSKQPAERATLGTKKDPEADLPRSAAVQRDLERELARQPIAAFGMKGFERGLYNPKTEVSAELPMPSIQEPEEDPRLKAPPRAPSSPDLQSLIEMRTGKHEPQPAVKPDYPSLLADPAVLSAAQDALSALHAQGAYPQREYIDRAKAQIAALNKEMSDIEDQEKALRARSNEAARRQIQGFAQSQYDKVSSLKKELVSALKALHVDFDPKAYPTQQWGFIQTIRNLGRSTPTELPSVRTSMPQRSKEAARTQIAEVLKASEQLNAESSRVLEATNKPDFAAVMQAYHNNTTQLASVRRQMELLIQEGEQESPAFQDLSRAHDELQQQNIALRRAVGNPQR